MLTMENPKTGAIKQAPVGFSWTVLFFGIFPPLFRGDWKWLIIMWMLMLFTLGLSNLVFMFIYNKLYIKDLIGQGFKVMPNDDIEKHEKKLGFKLPEA